MTQADRGAGPNPVMPTANAKMSDRLTTSQLNRFPSGTFSSLSLRALLPKSCEVRHAPLWLSSQSHRIRLVLFAFCIPDPNGCESVVFRSEPKSHKHQNSQGIQTVDHLYGIRDVIKM